MADELDQSPKRSAMIEDRAALDPSSSRVSFVSFY